MLVGLLHNTRTGHFVIYCGNNVVVADPKVFDTKEFTFFIEEEFCRITVTKTAEGYQYHFIIDSEAETPHNIARKAKDKLDQKKGIVVILGVMLFVAILIGGCMKYYSHYLGKQRAKNGAFAVGLVYLIPGNSSYSLSYSFDTEYRSISRQIEYYREPNPIASNGFPLYTYDEFYVQYAIKSPTNNEIFYERPTEVQLKRYKKRTQKIHLTQNPTDDSLYCNCLLDAAYAVKGLDGYGHFYYQNIAPSQNKRFNIKTYKEFRSTKAFENEAQKCREFLVLEKEKQD